MNEETARLTAYFRSYLHLQQTETKTDTELAVAAMSCLFHNETNGTECAVAFRNFLGTHDHDGYILSVWSVLEAPTRLPNVSAHNYLENGDRVISTLVEALPERFTNYNDGMPTSPMLYAIRHCLALTVGILRKRGAHLSVNECLSGEGMKGLAYTPPEVKEAFLYKADHTVVPYFDASVAVPDFEGGTALHLVVWRSGQQIIQREIEVLLQMGVNPLRLDKNRKTALNLLEERIDLLCHNKMINNHTEELQKAAATLKLAMRLAMAR